VTISSVGEAIGNITRNGGSSSDYLSDIEHDRQRFMRADDVIDG